MKNILSFAIILLLFRPAFSQLPARTMPDRLVTLRANYEQAIARATGPVNLQYRDALLKLKMEYTKAGNLEAALAVDDEIKSKFPSPPPVPAASAPALSPALAKVSVKNSIIANLAAGEKLYTESEYVWMSIPNEFAGMQFAQPKNKHAALTEFQVETPGVVYVAFASRWKAEDDNKKDDILSRKDLQRMGWKVLNDKSNLKSDEQGYEWIVCAKECKAGENFSLKTDKYCAPIVLVKSL